MIRVKRSFVGICIATILFCLLNGPLVQAASGVTWRIIGSKDTSGIGSLTPTNIFYWGGYKTSAQSGAWGRHIYVSTDSLEYTSSRRGAVEAYWQLTSYQYVPSTIHFDEQGANALHATMWYYTDLPNPERWSEDDDGDGRHEEFSVRWVPSSGVFDRDNWNIEVEYWDASTSNVNQGASGEMNVSQYTTTAIGKFPIASDWLWKYCFPAANSGTWFAC